MIGYYTKFTTNAESRERLAAFLSEAATSIKSIPECKLYEVSLDASDFTITVVAEVWADEAAHDVSLQTEETKKIIAQAMPLLTAPPEQIKFGSVITSWFN